MEGFKKRCPACAKNFSSLVEFMKHVKNEHEDISPEKMAEMGKEHKWKLRE